jgi:cytochrome c peroxidase
MFGRKRLLLFGAGVVLLLFLAAGTVSAADAGGDLLAQSGENVTDTQQANTTENGTADLPVEPPSQSHPGYEYVRQEGDTEAKIELGKQLFLDPRISETGTISCNSCHNIMEGGDQSVPKGVGVHGQTGPVNSPTVWNSAFHNTQFWDGRAATLAEQAEGPIVADVEMGMPDHQAALDRVRNVDGYVEQFEEVYGDEVGSDDPEELITLETVTDAIAAYERTLVTPNSSYDQYVQGDADALTQEQLDGMEEFTELGCQSCHSGPMFSGQWENPESGEFYGMKHPTYPDNEQCQQYIEEYDLMENPGRAGVTDDEADQYVYKVPTLRNVEHTAPYMHTGQVRTLDEAVRVMGACQLDTELSDEQVSELTAFLTSLTGEYPEQDLPRLPAPSGESMIPVDANGTLVEDPAEDAEPTDPAGGDDGGEDGSNGGISPTFLVVLVAAVVVIAVAVIAYTRTGE